jgi:predicted nucleic acid-binding protein
MPADVFFDTSVLVYTMGQQDQRTQVAEALLVAGGVVSVQVLNELVAVSRRKLRMEWREIQAATELIRSLCETPIPVSVEVHDHALRISQRHKYHIYDSLVIAAALEAGCAILYSEDMQDGHSIESLRIRNPFRNL